MNSKALKLTWYQRLRLDILAAVEVLFAVFVRLTRAIARRIKNYSAVRAESWLNNMVCYQL